MSEYVQVVSTNNFVFCGPAGDVLTINTNTGEVIVGEGLSTDEATREAARLFSEHLSSIFQEQRREIAKLNDEIKRLQE